jgi:hypothetical protein
LCPLSEEFGEAAPARKAPCRRKNEGRNDTGQRSDLKGEDRVRFVLSYRGKHTVI